MVTERIRLRTYVLSAAFWNPALLAREAATADRLTGGRLELGLGAGHMKSEVDDAVICVAAGGAADRTARNARARSPPAARRSDRAGAAARPIPLAIGAMSTRGLAVAADHADVVAFAGLRQVKGRPPGTITVASAAQTDALVAYVGERHGPRPYEADMLLQ